MKKFWLKFKKWILLILSIGTVTTAVLLGAPTDTISPDKVADSYDKATDIKAKYSLIEVSLIKTDIKNAELDSYKGEPKDEVKITIGDNEPIPAGYFGAGEKEFKPDIELKRWNEVSFKIKTDNLLKDVATKDKKLSFNGDKIKFDTPKISFEMYEVPVSAENPEGGYKYIWYLNEKPATNKVEFQIENSGLDFFYQPPLTQEYQSGYSQEFQKEIVVSETQVKDLDGNVLVERPENVVGSYAVYHFTKGGMNDAYGKDYKVGKAFHIYRPHLVDANGLETWGILKIENGIYSVEIPQDFLDKAVYPIKSNDTFGYTSAGTDFSQYIAGLIFGGEGYDIASVRKGTYWEAPANSGTLDSVSAYLKASADTEAIDTIAYVNQKDSGGTNIHGQIGSSETLNLSITTTAGWKTFNFASEAVTSGTNYFPNILGNGADIVGNSHNVGLAADNVSTNRITEGSTGAGSYAAIKENPWTATYGTASYKFSIYATYTPSGGGAVAEDPPIIIIVD